LRMIDDDVSQHHWHAGSVFSWDPMTFPASATTYAKNYVNAWIAGNTIRMNLLGTTALTGIYQGMATPTTSFTVSAPINNGSGEVEVEIKDSTTHLDTSVIIHTASLGHAHAIGGCDIGC
jgi:hypothetical protein